MTCALDLVIGPVQTLSEVHFMLLILVIAIRVVEDVFGTGSSRCSASCLVETHTNLTTNCASCRDGPVIATNTTVSMLVRRIHPDVRCILGSSRGVTQPTRVTALAAHAHHGLGVGDEVALRLSFIDLAQIVVLGEVCDASHVLNLNHLVVCEAGAVADPPIALHHQV